MSQSNIDYRVKDADKFKPAKKSKQISKIGEKSNQFQFQSQEDFFQLQLTFKSPAIINLIQLKVRRVNQVTFEMYNENVEPVKFHFFYNSEEVANGATKHQKLKQKSANFTKAIVRFMNHSQPKATCIGYILFKGIKQQSAKKNTRVNNVGDIDAFIKSQKKKVGDDHKKIFEDRNKQKQTKKPGPEKLLLSVTQQPWKKNAQEEDSQLRRVIELSKKEINKQYVDLTDEPKKNRIKHEELIEDQNQFFQYDVVEWEKVKKNYEHVTVQWVQAQKTAERQLKIQERHSVAQRIKIKIFSKQQFCINNINGAERVRLAQLVKQLGGKIVDNPVSGCYILTNRMEGGKINLAKGMDQIKYVKPDYVMYCDKMRTKLEIKQYHP